LLDGRSRWLGVGRAVVKRASLDTLSAHVARTPARPSTAHVAIHRKYSVSGPATRKSLSDGKFYQIKLVCWPTSSTSSQILPTSTPSLTRCPVSSDKNLLPRRHRYYLIASYQMKDTVNANGIAPHLIIAPLFLRIYNDRTWDDPS
jgi:hypothetical protein